MGYLDILQLSFIILFFVSCLVASYSLIVCKTKYNFIDYNAMVLVHSKFEGSGRVFEKLIKIGILGAYISIILFFLCMFLNPNVV